MDSHLEISVELESNMDSRPSRWRERCLARVQNLKNQFHDLYVVGSDSNDVQDDDNNDDHNDMGNDDEDDQSDDNDNNDNEPSQKFMCREIYEAAPDGEVDAFIDVLEAQCAQNETPLYNIVYHTTPDGDTVLHVAAKFGSEKITEVIALHYPEFLTWQNTNGDTPLHVAARTKSTIQVMKVLLFEYAVQYDQTKITQINNVHGNTPLHETVMSKHLERVSLLLRPDQAVAHRAGTTNVVLVHYPRVEFKPRLPSPLYMAVETGDVKILQLLLQIPFPLNDPAPKHHGYSPLHAAILCHNPGMLKEIVNMRPSLMELRDENGGNALHFAAQMGYVEGVRILLNKSTLQAFEIDNETYFPIHIACKMGHLNVVKELLQQEWPDPKILVSVKGHNILHIAAENGKNNVVKYLLKNPKIDTSMVNQRDNEGNTPLHLGSKNLCLWTLLALSRDKRVDVNSKNNDGLIARDISWVHSSTPKTRQQFLCEIILGRAGVPLTANIFGTPNYGRNRNNDWNVKEAGNTLIIVGALIATVTFAAGFTVPGGVYGSDEADPRNRGMAVLTHDTLFKIFMVFNLVAMYSSTLGSVIILWVQMGDRRFSQGAYELAKVFVYLALVTMSVAFMAAIRLIVDNNRLLVDVVTVGHKNNNPSEN